MRTKIITILVLAFFFTTNAQDKKWTLQECINYAVENNISIKQQELSKELIKEDIVTAKGSFLPSLSASASQNFNFGSYIDNYGGRVSRDSRSNSFGISSGVTLYNGNINKINLLQTQKNLEAAGFDLEENKNSIMLFVVNSYLNVLLNKESIVIAEEQILISKSQVEQTKALVDAGEVPRANLLEAEATLASNEQQLTSAQNTLDLALLNLAQLLQVSHKGFDIESVTLNIDSASLIYNDTDAIFNTALTSLPEIKSAEIAVENSELSVDRAKAGFLPSLSFGAGVGTSYQHNQGSKDVRAILDENNNVVYVPNGFGQQLEDNLGFNAGFSLSIPIFNRFQTKTAVAKAEINQQRAELALLDKQIKLRETIEQAYADAKAALNQYISAEKSLYAQNESFKNAQESYNAGVMTSFDFDQVRNRLVNAQSSMANAKYNFVFRTKLLEYYLGIPIVLN
ncbi:TolC family protein [Lutibacter sp. A64]|uniref:TolC family protein n=1 Tax=Lutibacter sp. A64 TaxID=2918526 RepID=UPI001F069020|nr:TolC family protein [Lutibacter sp. A64]UMB52721.1 TolC family protein [Lutibacter sp. A64]